MSQKTKLTQEESSAIKAFISNYNDLFKDISTMEQELDFISKRRDSLMTKLNKVNSEITAIRKKEKEYNDYLVSKYGQFSLN
jgi:peptidoglycan hydrolase CwlO-like protein